MTLGQWTSSPQCRAGGACGPCRDAGTPGESFRAALARDGWDLPADGPPFACPHGKPWGFVPEGAPPPVDEDEQALFRAAANPEGMGDRVAALIHKAGADRAWGAVRRLAGMSESCGGCNARREALNRLEGWVKGIFG